MRAMEVRVFGTGGADYMARTLEELFEAALTDYLQANFDL